MLGHQADQEGAAGALEFGHAGERVRPRPPSSPKNAL
jgi:hypothetical protein